MRKGWRINDLATMQRSGIRCSGAQRHGHEGGILRYLQVVVA